MAEYRQKTADRRFFVCTLLIVAIIIEICIDKFVFCAIIQVWNVNGKGVTSDYEKIYHNFNVPRYIVFVSFLLDSKAPVC